MGGCWEEPSRLGGGFSVGGGFSLEVGSFLDLVMTFPTRLSLMVFLGLWFCGWVDLGGWSVVVVVL